MEKLKRHAHFSSSASTLPQGHFKTSELDPGRIIFYKKGLLIDHIYYICEISYNQQGFFISLYAVEPPTVSISLHLKNNARTDQIMKRVDYNFDMLAHSLKIKGGRIYIDKNLGSNQDIYGSANCSHQSIENAERQLPPSLTHYHSLRSSQDKSLNNLEHISLKRTLHAQTKLERLNDYNNLVCSE